MGRLITSLPALECFRAAAELESFSRAAARMNLTHGAVSRAVRLLERDLGTLLFIRRNRAVFLTENGRKLAQAVAQGLGHIETTVRSIKVQQANAPVTVSCEPTLMMRWLIPRLPDLRRLHPEADIRLVAGGGPVAFDSGIDMAIRRDDFDMPDSCEAEPLFSEWIGPVCRPDLRDRFFQGDRLRSDAPLLHSRTRISAWQTWADLAGEPIDTKSGSEFEHFYFSLQAAIAGLGVAIGPWHLVRDDLSSGLLQAPAGFRPDGSRYFLIKPDKRPWPDTEKLFHSWLAKLAQSEAGPE